MIVRVPWKKRCGKKRCGGTVCTRGEPPCPRRPSASAAVGASTAPATIVASESAAIRASRLISHLPQEVEVAPVFGLEDVVHVQLRIPALRGRHAHLPRRAPATELDVVDEKIETPLAHAELDAIAVPDERERA